MTKMPTDVNTSVALNKTNCTEQVRLLNDAFRTTFQGGMVVITKGTQELSDEGRLALLEAIRSFSDFNPDNDPYGEHDFGSIKLNGRTFFWKIDCYDLHMLAHSPDATDPNVTKRVMTIMLAQEY